jgi:hypothetical protein
MTIMAAPCIAFSTGKYGRRLPSPLIGGTTKVAKLRESGVRGLLAGRKNRAAFVYGFVDREEGGYLTDWWDLGTFHIVADTPSATCY